MVTIKYRILIVDNQTKNSNYVEQLLNDIDCTIHKANSVNEALNILNTYEPALMIIDMQITKANKHDILQLIHSIDPTHFLPVIILSNSFSDEEFMEQTFQTGPIDFLIKPVQPVIIKGKVNMFLELYQQQKQLEYELQTAREKAVESERLKTAFMANMSHEIRTPLNAIVGFTNLLKSPTLTNEKKTTYLQYINDSSEVLATIISDMIDIAKIEAKQLEILLKDACIPEIFEELFNEGQVQLSSLSKTNITLKLSIPEKEKNYTLYIDELRFKQIVKNLLTNAIKFTREGTIEFGFKLDENRKPLFFVYDTGIGIIKSNQTAIFESFRQIPQEENATISGTGLGLSIVQKMVELMGGSINVLSEPGEGTRFEFTIDAKENTKNIPDISNQIDSSLQHSIDNLKILIAEDEYINYEYLKAVLPKTAHIDWARDGQQAIDLARKIKYDIILMDIKMPVKSGYEAFSEIRRFNPDTPIVAQTAYAMMGRRQQIIKYGFDGYLPKPINSNKLLNMITSLTHASLAD